MSETCQKLAFTHPIVVLKSGLKNNWMKKLDRVNRPLADHITAFIYQAKHKRTLISHSFRGVLGLIPFPKAIN